MIQNNCDNMHKIADDMSTIAIVLIKGKVLNNFNKRIVFIKAC
jgi:hypothetical protein